MHAMRLSDLLGQDATGRLSDADKAVDIVGLTADSRTVAPGYLFAALPGAKADGARFIAEARARGAVAILGSAGAVPADAGVVLSDRNPRRAFALLAARFYAPQPDTVAAVTGTNGKTSVASFTRQIWERLGRKSASIGTLGIVTVDAAESFGLTTPDPVVLHRALAGLKAQGIEHVAMEASSHGLAQYRLDGVRLEAAAITNITHDHLDYHGTFADYTYAKLRLLGELLRPGAAAIINADADIAQEAEALAWARGHRVMTVGQAGRTIRLEARVPERSGQRLSVLYNGRATVIALPLAGLFQASNALVAAALAIGTGAEAAAVFASLEHLKGAPGRLELVASLAGCAPIYVDYAHTPDALATVLDALRPHVRGRLHVVFGCGGDRDRSKRPEMGRIAVAKAERVIVTDDNPRTEDASAIRAEILAAAPGALEIADRAEAIAEAIEGLAPEDCLVVAGKGHETGQIIGDKTIPFNDADEIRRAVAEREQRS